jgi:hypothetical protein
MKLAQMAAFDDQAGVTSLAMYVSVSNACTLSTHKVLLRAGQKRLAFCQGEAQGTWSSTFDRRPPNHRRCIAAVINKSGLNDHLQDGSSSVLGD